MRATATHATITHREFVGDVDGSVLFGSSQYALNPGNSVVFPWLSSIALNYESYVFKQLHFHYETSVSTTTAGTVMMAVDYDASDAAPASKQILMGYAQAQRSAPWQECAFNCRSGDLHKFAAERYVRGLTIPTGDVKTYDVGNLFLATQGNATGDMIGELYVSYTVELRTPQIHNSLPATPLVRSLTMTRGNTDSSFTGGITAAFQPGSDLQPSATAAGISLANMVIGNHYCMSYYTAASGMGSMFFNVFTGANQLTIRYNTSAVPQATVMITFVATATTVGIEPDPAIAGNYSATELIISECAPFP
jgi:hypothetical protein